MPAKSYQEEQTHNKDYWYGELRSLGIEPKRTNSLNDNAELGALADNIKQTMFQDYKTATDSKDESRFNHII
jgi:hypothetical protein